MDKQKKKIEGLRAQLGLMLGKDVAKNEATQPAAKAISKQGAADERNVKTSTNNSVLSDGLARQLRARLGLSEPVPSMSPHESLSDTPALEIDALLEGKIIGAPDYGFFLYRREYPLDYALGDVPLNAALSCHGGEVALSACDDGLLAFSPQETCFMDTETTGLAGGAGTTPFLVGMGFFQDNLFVLEQCFLRDYDDEAPLLEYLQEQLPRFTAIVSYNGKSFDLPLLRSRFVQHRIPFPLEGMPHYDLVHAARRIWKDRLTNCSLSNIEQEVLGFRRTDDVPGYLIPHLWLDYLDTRNARPLASVFHHHKLDILSLVALTGHLNLRLADRQGSSFVHAEDRVSVIRLHFKRKRYDAAIDLAQQFLDVSRVADPLRRECLRLLGQSYKKTGQFEEMERTWRVLHEEYPDDIRATEELAKYLEHQKRAFGEAMHVCLETMRHLESPVQPHLLADFGPSALRGRLIRLERKIAKAKQQNACNEDNFFS